MAMSFLSEPARGGIPFRVLGQVDYRLARNLVVNQYRKGHVSRLDICDAHPELLRAAIAVGEESGETCPICDDIKLRLVSYVFGPRIPPSGRCIASSKELARLASAGKDLACYVIEVCPGCSWNHLARVVSFVALTNGTSGVS
jgi:hypothetical protein